MSGKIWVGVCVALIASLFAANRAFAQTDYFEANMDPFQEVPPHNTPGYGYTVITLNVSNSQLTVSNGDYADLLAGATSVVLQDVPVGMNGPTIANLTLDTYGNTTGTFSGTGYQLTNQQVMDLMNGNVYVNVRDSVYPSGEIRGQLESVPEPASMSLLIAGGSLMLARRRRAA